jgi:hypothetical protein
MQMKKLIGAFRDHAENTEHQILRRKSRPYFAFTLPANIFKRYAYVSRI